MAATPNTSAARAVLIPLWVAAWACLVWEWPRGSGWLSGASPLLCHGSVFPARCVSSSPATQMTAIRTTSGREPEPDQGRRQLRAHDDRDEDGEDDGALDDQGEAGGLIGQGAALAHAEGIERDEHHGLDRDTTEDVADRDVEMAAGRCAVGDGDLGQVRGDREQDQSARASPRCSRSASTSVLSDRKIPAIQIVTALAMKTRRSAQNERCGSRFMSSLSGRRAGRNGSRSLVYGNNRR